MHQRSIGKGCTDGNGSIQEGQRILGSPHRHVVGHHLQQLLHGNQPFTPVGSCPLQEGGIPLLQEALFRFAPVVQRVDGLDIVQGSQGFRLFTQLTQDVGLHAQCLQIACPHIERLFDQLQGLGIILRPYGSHSQLIEGWMLEVGCPSSCPQSLFRFGCPSGHLVEIA